MTLTQHLADSHVRHVATQPLRVHLSCAHCHWVATVYGADVAERILREHSKTHEAK